MWYLRKVAISCEQFGPVSTCVCPKYIKFFFQILGLNREDETDVDRLLLASIMKENLPIYVAKIWLY